MKWVILIFGIASNVAASVLIKTAITPPRRFPSLSEPMASLLNWPLWLGLFFYGATFLFYAAALTRLPLNIVHPILTSGAIVFVALLSGIMFRETFYWTTILGIAMIVVGVILLTARGG